MSEPPDEIDVIFNESFFSICNHVCTALKPSGNRKKDEEFIFATLCQRFAERGNKNVSFKSTPGSSKLDNLKEHLFLLVNNQEKSDQILEYVYEFLDNIYPEDELWKLKI